MAGPGAVSHDRGHGATGLRRRDGVGARRLGDPGLRRGHTAVRPRLLGSHFRRLANEAAEAGRAGDRKKYRAAYEKLDRVAVDELRVLGTRYRVVRVEQFIRLGPDGPEPPRPSDPDPGEVGEAHRLPSRIKGFVIDPYIGTGMAEGLLKFDLMQFVLKAGTAPPDVRGDSLRAVETHPGGVLLPAEFAIAECGGDGQWKPHSGAAPSPQAARDRLAVDFRVMTPIQQRLSEAEREEYARAADRLDEKRGAGIAVAGRRYRVARVEQLVRIGPDGPEGPALRTSTRIRRSRCMRDN